MQRRHALESWAARYRPVAVTERPPKSVRVTAVAIAVWPVPTTNGRPRLTPLLGSAVIATPTSGAPVRAQVNRKGHAYFQLPPGRYALASSIADTCLGAVVTLKAGHPLTADLRRAIG
jgi:hypothetical protein